MNKLKETVLRPSTIRSPAFSASQMEDRYDSLFSSLSASIHTPTHPPYSEMIIEAIRDLNEKDGSKESSVSSFIELRQQDLPIAHAHLLAHHLKMLVKRGEIIFNSKSRYQIPISNPNNHEIKQQKQRKRRKSRRGARCKWKSDSEVQLTMIDDEAVVSVGDGEIGGDLSYPVDVDGFENPNPSPERKRPRICVGWNEERRELEQQEEEQGMVVRDETVLEMVDRFLVSPQLQINNEIETEVLKKDAQGGLMICPLGVGDVDNGVVVPHNEQQHMVKKKDGGGRPRKVHVLGVIDNGGMVSQNEQQQMVKECRGRPKKIHALAVGDIDNNVMVPQNGEQQILKKKSGRGRPKKKKQEPQQEGDTQFVIQKETRSSVDDHGLNSSPCFHSLPFDINNDLMVPQNAQQQILKKKGGRGRPKKKKQEPELEGERPFVIINETRSSVDDHGLNAPLRLYSLSLDIDDDVMVLQNAQQQILKKGSRGRPRKNKQDKLAVLVKSQLTMEEESATAKAAEKVKQPLAVELEQLQQQQQLGKKMKPWREVDRVDDKCVPPPKKRNRETILKYMQEPQLPRRQLRPRPLVKALAEETQEEETQTSEPNQLQPITNGDLP